MAPVAKSDDSRSSSSANLLRNSELDDSISRYSVDRLSAAGWTREELLPREKRKRPKFKFYSLPYLFRSFPRLSMKSLVRTYIPMMGVVSYEALSLHLVHKRIFSRVFGDRDLSVVNSLLYTSHVGIGLYIYNSPPVCFAASYNRLMYSVFGSVIFNFGSLLLWSTLRNTVQNFHPAAKIFLAMSCATTALFVGTDYLHFLCAWLRGQP